jgi:hypothetical protein
MLKFVFYDNMYSAASAGQATEESWEKFVEFVKEPEPVDDKGKATQVFFGELTGEAKADTAVVSVHCLVIDMDSIPAKELHRVENTLAEEKWTAILHSTYRHAEYMQHDPPVARVRVILPLSRPVAPEEYVVLWANANLVFHKFADGTTRAPSKHYLVPSIPEGEYDSYIFKEFEGERLNPDDVMTRYNTKVIANTEVELFEVGKERVSDGMLKTLLEGKHSKEDKPFIDAMRRALGRLSYAEEGEREKMLFGMAGVFAKNFPRGNPDDICAALEYSIKYEHKRGAPSLRDFKDKLVRRQRDYLQRAAERRIESEKGKAKEAKSKLLREPYTAETLEKYFERCDNKISFESLKEALVLVHRNGYYVFGDGQYHYATSTSLLATIRKWLLHRADGLGFDYYYPREGDKPPTPKSHDHFVRDHGSVIKEVRYTHRGVSWYEEGKQILWVSECEDSRDLVPERCEEFEAWAKCLCHNDIAVYNKFCQWLSQVPDTTQALAGLVLAGPTGIGKSAFAEGVSQLWGSAPGSMVSAMSQFNSEMIATPVVFADESLPEVNGKVPTDKLRSLISSSKHEINRKGQPIARLHSFVRVIVALQNMSKFDFGRGHTKEDNAAIGKRFLFILGTEAAARLFLYDLFVNRKGIAKHILWLAQTMKRSSDRFGLETNGESYVLAADPYAMKIADFILNYLMAKVYSSEELKQPNKKLAAFVNREEVYVNVPTLRHEWDLYQTGRDKNYVPSVMDVTQAIRAMSLDTDPTRIRMPSGHESFWRVNKEVLWNRAMELGELTSDQFDLLLKIPHEIAFNSKAFDLTSEHKERRSFALKKYKEAK